PEVRLLYLHGGGFVSGSGGFQVNRGRFIFPPTQGKKETTPIYPSRPGRRRAGRQPAVRRKLRPRCVLVRIGGATPVATAGGAVNSSADHRAKAGWCRWTARDHCGVGSAVLEPTSPEQTC